MKVHPPGIRRTPTGWQVFVKRKGQYRSQRFPLKTDLMALKEAREKLIGAILHKLDRPTPIRTFAEDAADYLELVKAMPSYQDRAYHIGRWAEVFGTRDRATITAKEIRAALESWRKTGSQTGGPLKPGSLNRRRTALMDLFTTLDGKSAPNIVKDVPAFDERGSEQIRAQPMLVCAQLIRHLRPLGRMRAILHVLMWTGWTSALLTQVRAEDIDWERGRVRLSRRQKGQGMPAEWVPVVPRALLALRRLQRHGFGPFSNSSLHKALGRAVETENRRRLARHLPPLPHVHPYTLRHAFGTWAAGIVKDDKALRELMRTNSIDRYTSGALAGRMEQARDQLTGNRGKQSRPSSPIPDHSRETGR